MAAQAAGGETGPVVTELESITGPVTTTAPGEEIDFSVMGMFLRATFTVQAVMIILVLASFWSWAIIIEKWFSFARLRGQSVAARHAALIERPISPIQHASLKFCIPPSITAPAVS